MSARMQDRAQPQGYLCGWCEAAALSENPHRHHGRCVGPCICGAAGHRFDAKLAGRLAAAAHISIDQVYAAHGRRRRQLSPEQRERAILNLRRPA